MSTVLVKKRSGHAEKKDTPFAYSNLDERKQPQESDYVTLIQSCNALFVKAAYSMFEKMSNYEVNKLAEAAKIFAAAQLTRDGRLSELPYIFDELERLKIAAMRYGKNGIYSGGN